MRYLDKVVFIKKMDSYYDPELGEHVDGELKETILDCNVTDLGSERSVALFGDVQEKSKVIRLQPLNDVPTFDYLMFNDISYKLSKNVNPQDRKTMIVKEFSNG